MSPFSIQNALRRAQTSARRTLALLAVAALALFFASAATARPGGGGSYHGSGGGAHVGGASHATHGGGGGPGASFPTGGGLFGGDPRVGGDLIAPPTIPFGSSAGLGWALPALVLVIVVGIAIAVPVLRARAERSSVADDPGGPPPRSRSLDGLREHDPALTEDGLNERVRSMAEGLKNAWCAGDMAPARPFVSDGVFTRFRVQLALMAIENRRNVMGDARIVRTSLVDAASVPPLDVATLRVAGEARDAEVPRDANSDAIARTLARSPVAPYAEIWTLVRRQGARTPTAPGFVVGQACPSCGAPLTPGAMIKCRYCGALVCSGEHDWVLVEITQESEWRPAEERLGVDALVPLRPVDPLISRPVIEDRASTIFWKWIEAARVNGAALTPFAWPSMLADSAAVAWPAQVSDVAVGGASTESCGRGADGFDRVDVSLRWSGRFGGARAYTTVQSRLRLARRSGVQSAVSLSALVCKACGAPLGNSDQPTCVHCGAPLSTGDQDWVLESVVSATLG